MLYYCMNIFFMVLTVTSTSISNKLNQRLETPTTTSKSTTTTKASEPDSVEFDPQVLSEKNKILVVNGHCNVINKFSLSHNFSFNCNYKYLPIDFALRHQNGNEKILTAYLDSTNNDLHNSQDVTQVCRKIRRYQVDDKYTIIIVKNEIKLLEITEADHFIELELLKNFNFLTYLFFKLDVYDEESDQLMYLEALKNLVFYYIILGFAIKVICKLYGVVRTLIKLIEQYNATHSCDAKNSNNNFSTTAQECKPKRKRC